MDKADFYRRLILREFYFSKFLSCADLSERIGKSLPLTTKIVNELIEDELVVESGFAPSSGGRRPLMYSIRPDTLYVLSVAMDQLLTRISLVDIQNRQVIAVENLTLPLKENANALSILMEKMEEEITKSGIDKNKILGIGIGMPGFIDFKKGINYSFLETRGETLQQVISNKLQLPVYIDNDSSLIALAELRFGSARNKKNIMVVNLSWGVGLGMVLNGELFRGHNGFAGEFSHMSLFSNNKLCACGKTGCLETETSLLVLIEKVRTGLATGRLSGLGREFPTGDFEKDCDAIISAGLKGDQFAIELISEVGYNIGRGLAILIHLVNPEAVILSGRGALAGKLWEAPIQQALNEHCIPRLVANTVVEISTMGYQAQLMGAAALVMENRAMDDGRQVLSKDAQILI